MITLKNYEVKYLPAMIDLFYETVHYINQRDYSEEQLRVWASKDINTHDWKKRLTKNTGILAFENDILVGFGEIFIPNLPEDSAYLDMLYVHKDFQGKGIAQKIYDKLEELAYNQGLNKIITEASITARPFFAQQGFEILKTQQKLHKGMLFLNYVMEKNL